MAQTMEQMSTISGSGCVPRHTSLHHMPNTVIICQMLEWWMKNSPCFFNTRDNITKVVPLCAVYQPPSYKPSFTLLACLLPKLAYLSILFILEMASTVHSAGHLKNK